MSLYLEQIRQLVELQHVDDKIYAVKKELEADAEMMAGYALQTDAWNQVLETSEIKEYPEEDIQEAIDAYKALNEEYIQQAEMDMSEFLKSQGITEEEYEEECRQYAESKVEQNLIVQYIMDQENLSFEDEDAEEGECYILKEDVGDRDEEYGMYEFVEDEKELEILFPIFEELLEDSDTEVEF